MSKMPYFHSKNSKFGLYRTFSFMSSWVISATLMSCASNTKSGDSIDPLASGSESSSNSLSTKCYQPNYLKVGDQGIQLEVTLRDFSSNFPDFENFNSKKPNPSIEDCGSLEQPELANIEAKETYLTSLRDRFPDHFPWATSNSREIYPTFGMLKAELGEDGLPIKGRQACNNDHIDKWYRDIEGVNYKIQDKLELKPIGDDLYQVEFLHFNNNSYLPLDKFAESKEIKSWGKQNLPIWCLGNISECQKLSDEKGQTPNSVPDGSNFGFTMTTAFDFVYNSHYGEYFEFDGDDDYWLYIDGKLAVDAGGTHVLIHNKVNLDSLAKARQWLDGSTHSFKLFFAERQADASNLSMKFKTKGIQDLNEIPPYIYRSYELGLKEDPKYMLYVNTALDDISISKIQKNLDKGVFTILDDQDNDVSADMKVISFKKVTDQTVLSAAQAAYEIQFENSDDTKFVAPSLGYKISFNPEAPISIQSKKGLKVKEFHHASVSQKVLMGEESMKALTQDLCK